MKSTRIDRITVSFYEETFDDKVLLEILNRQSQIKFRGQKMKDIFLQYYRENFPTIIVDIESQLKPKSLNTNSQQTQDNLTVLDEPVKSIGNLDTW